MKLYKKYIVGRIIGPMLLISFCLTGLIWLIQSLRFIDLIVNRGLGVSTFLYLSSLLLPSLLIIVLPAALFISIIYALNKLNIESELIALKNSGLSISGLIRPVIMVALCITFISYIFTLYLMPASYREFKDMQIFIRDNYISVLLQEGVFSTPTKGLTVYIRSIQNNGMLKGILVHDNRVAERPVTMMASEGQLVKTATGPRFIMINGNRQEVNFTDSQLALLYFDRYALDLSAFARETQNRAREMEELYLNELFNAPSQSTDQQKQRFLAEGHQRITWPLYNILLALIAVIPFVRGQFNRRGQMKQLLITGIIAVSFISLGMTLKNSAVTHPQLIPLMYVLVLGGIGFCSYIIVKDVPPALQRLLRRVKFNIRLRRKPA